MNIILEQHFASVTDGTLQKECGIMHIYIYIYPVPQLNICLKEENQLAI